MITAVLSAQIGWYASVPTRKSDGGRASGFRLGSRAIRWGSTRIRDGRVQPDAGALHDAATGVAAEWLGWGSSFETWSLAASSIDEVQLGPGRFAAKFQERFSSGVRPIRCQRPGVTQRKTVRLGGCTNTIPDSHSGAASPESKCIRDAGADSREQVQHGGSVEHSAHV